MDIGKLFEKAKAEGRSDEEIQFLERAYEFARKAHIGQKR